MSDAARLLALDRLLMRARIDRARDLPISIFVIADLLGKPAEPRPPFVDRRFERVSAPRLDALMATLQPRLAFLLPGGGGADEPAAVDLTLCCMADFEPARLRERCAQALRGDGTGALDGILHHPQFQALESSWRGLQTLLRQTWPHDGIEVRVLDATKAELWNSLRKFKGSARDQSPLFQALYDREFRHFGGEPCALLLTDHEFADTPADIDALRELGLLAAASHACLVAGVSPALLRQRQFSEVANLRSVEAMLRSGAYQAWNALRDDTACSASLVLTMPRVLARSPHRAARSRHAGLPFDESLADAQGPPYASAALALGARLGVALARVEASGALAIMQRGGLVEGLPVPTGLAPHALDANLRASLQEQLHDAGFNVLAPLAGSARVLVAAETSFGSGPPVLHRLLAGRVAHRLQRLRYQQAAAPAVATAPLEAIEQFVAACGGWPDHVLRLPVPLLAGATVCLDLAAGRQVLVEAAGAARRDEVVARLAVALRPAPAAAAAPSGHEAGRWFVEHGGAGQPVVG